MSDLPDVADDPISAFVHAMTSLSYAMSRNLVHAELAAAVDVRIDRAGLAALRVLVDADRPLRFNELAERLMVRAPHATRQVVVLEAEGLVERTRDAADHRAQLVQLTETGRQAVDRMDSAVRDRLRQALAGESSTDIRTAARIMNRISANAKKI
ncbi:MarR family winged helix-turn-helix transcriptional regulator [Streptomyces sp. NPDC096311]|uniref:MarR family winged helix-turn-helix transcriptional regulator n=1 Tax=Streptomyces sp. NPDC096311 TaxID=3366083 RepID=UPI0037F29648